MSLALYYDKKDFFGSEEIPVSGTPLATESVFLTELVPIFNNLNLKLLIFYTQQSASISDEDISKLCKECEKLLLYFSEQKSDLSDQMQIRLKLIIDILKRKIEQNDIGHIYFA